MTDDELCFLPATQCKQLLAQGELSSLELMSAVANRIESHVVQVGNNIGELLLRAAIVIFGAL